MPRIHIMNLNNVKQQRWCEHRLELAKKTSRQASRGVSRLSPPSITSVRWRPKRLGRFLGVSVNTITSRLQRARKRLQDDQEHLIKEVLGGRQIPTRLSESIKRQIADMKPTPSRQLENRCYRGVPFGTAMVVIILMIGVSSRYLKPFSETL